MRIAGKTDIGYRRGENQDTFRGGEIDGFGGWGVVCDGMGGGQHGRLASEVAADCIEEMLYQQVKLPGESGSIEQMLQQAVDLANSEVYACSGKGEEMMGTTVVAAILSEKTLNILHVGDSRAYMFENDTLVQLTRDHSMVQEMVDMGTISSEEASNHPERNVITRALGVEQTVQTTLSKYAVKPGAVIMMCTDGLTGMLSDREIENIMKSNDFYSLPHTLVNAALKAGGDDNVTVLVMQNN